MFSSSQGSNQGNFMQQSSERSEHSTFQPAPVPEPTPSFSGQSNSGNAVQRQQAQPQFPPQMQQQLAALMAVQGQQMTPQMQRQLAASMMSPTQTNQTASQIPQQVNSTMGSHGQQQTAKAPASFGTSAQQQNTMGGEGTCGAKNSTNSSQNIHGFSMQSSQQQKPAQHQQIPMNLNLQQMHMQLQQLQSQQQGIQSGMMPNNPNSQTNTSFQQIQNMNQPQLMFQPQQMQQFAAAMMAVRGNGGQFQNFFQQGAGNNPPNAK
jgi:hypothetical protein